MIIRKHFYVFNLQVLWLALVGRIVYVMFFYYNNQIKMAQVS